VSDRRLNSHLKPGSQEAVAEPAPGEDLDDVAVDPDDGFSYLNSSGMASSVSKYLFE